MQQYLVLSATDGHSVVLLRARATARKTHRVERQAREHDALAGTRVTQVEHDVGALARREEKLACRLRTLEQSAVGPDHVKGNCLLALHEREPVDARVRAIHEAKAVGARVAVEA